MKVAAAPAQGSRSGWGARPLLLGTLIAVAVGGAVGVAGALLHDRPPVLAESAPKLAVAPSPAPPPPVAQPAPPQPATPPPELPPLALEHQLTESGFTLRCGLEHPPAPGRASPLLALLTDGRGPLAGAQVEARVRAPSGDEERLLFGAESGGPYRATYTFGAPGRYRLRVTAATSARPQPLVLAFDVEVAAPHRAPSTHRAPAPHRARVAARKSHDEDLPVTVVPPAAPPPQRVVATPPSSTPPPASPPPIITAPPPQDPGPQPIDPYQP